MKKLLLFIVLFSVVSSLFAYTSEDLDNASFLASEGIITERDDPRSYRLDDTITRQEAVGIALKVGAYETPSDYVCQGYYQDAKFAPSHRDAWVCASAEAAADNGIISRERTTFHPKANITKAEALAMLMKAADIDYASEAYNGSDVADLYSPRTPEWQITLLEGSNALGIIDLSLGNGSPEDNFQPNKPATRAQVFEFAMNIYKHGVETSTPETSDGSELQGSIVEKNNGYTQYTSSDGDHTVSYPSNMVIKGENEGYFTIKLVTPDFTPESGGFIFGVIKADCDTPDCTYQTLYDGFKEWFTADGDIKILKENTGKIMDRDSTLIEYTQDVDGDLLHGYMQIVYVNNTLYAVMALSDNPHFTQNQRELQKFLKSFTIR